MATATEIATKALKRLAIVAPGESPSAAELSDATDALNAMIAAWETGALSGDVLPLDKRFEQGIIALLAVRLAEDYGKEPGPILTRDADNGWAGLQGAFLAVPQQQFDRALKYTGPATANGYFYDAQNDALSLWQPATVYLARDTVSNGFNIYECTTGGTSATGSGPTGTSDTITDGTCIWVWRRVDGARDAIITIS